MDDHDSDGSESQEPYKGVVDLQEVCQPLHSLVISKHFEDFEQPSDLQQTIKPGEPEQSKERVVIVTFVIVGVELMLDQTGGDAR